MVRRIFQTSRVETLLTLLLLARGQSSSRSVASSSLANRPPLTPSSFCPPGPLPIFCPLLSTSTPSSSPVRSDSLRRSLRPAREPSCVAVPPSSTSPLRRSLRTIRTLREEYLLFFDASRRWPGSLER